MNVEELNRTYAIPDAVRFEAGEGGLTRAVVETPLCEAHVYLHGAHLTHWRPAGEEPVLFTSAASRFEDGQPVRGGAPLCHPWFGRRKDAPDAPLHGIVRLTDWDVESVSKDSSGVVTLVLTLSARADLGRGEQPFACRHTLEMGRDLRMALETRNTGDRDMTLTEAIHTYFAVDDVRTVRVLGLEGRSYGDATDEEKRKTQGDAPIRVEAEIDRCYTGTDDTCVLEIPGRGRRVVIEKSGSRSTVVWNPWVAKAARMEDFGDDEWPRMICIETANAHEDAVTLPPGEAHTLEARVRVEVL